MMSSRLAVALLIASCSVASGANAFGIKRAHEELALAAIEDADREGALDQYLREALGLSRGLQQPLALQFGLDSRVDEDLVTDPTAMRGFITRLNRSRSLLDEDDNGPAEYPFAPNALLFFFDQNCRSASDFEACFAALERAPVERLIALGTYAEDNPNTRSRHHFHDPERAHGPSDNYGLDETDVLPGAIDDVLADLAAAYGRGGSWLRAIGNLFFWDFRARKL